MQLTDTPINTFNKAMKMAIDGKYEIDAENKQAILDLVGYFSNTSTSLNPRKGILIRGNPGSGKTLLMEIFSRLVRNLSANYSLTTCQQISEDYSHQSIKSIYAMRLTHRNYFFDDLGVEIPANHYGKVEVMHQLIFKVYDIWRKEGNVFHFTTNRDDDEIIERYGDHCLRRLKQMCNVINLGVTIDSRDRSQDSIPRILTEEEEKAFPKFYITAEEKQEDQLQKEFNIEYAKRKEAARQTVQQPPMSLGDRMAKNLGFKR